MADQGDRMARLLAALAGHDQADALNGWSTVRLEAAQALRAAR